MTITPTDIGDHVAFIKRAAAVTSTKGVKDLIATLPVVPESDYLFDAAEPARGWKQGSLHWYPVGGDRGNAGRIKLAHTPENPIAERTVNAMEAMIELERQKELRTDPATIAPQTPREAAQRYFDLPALDALPTWPHPIRGQKPFNYARHLARKIRLRLVREKQPVEYTFIIEDEGIGQTPGRMHDTLLSLGRSDKADKPYLIGVFGQGGSSTFFASDYSWILTRRAPELDDPDDGVGWTLVKRIVPGGRRDVYWAYLAAHPDGRVLRLSSEAANAIGFVQGTRFTHVNYNFGKTEPARTLYQSLNHLIFKPVLPYELYTRPAPSNADPMWGNGYRLSNLKDEVKALDKTFAPQSVEKKGEG